MNIMSAEKLFFFFFCQKSVFVVLWNDGDLGSYLILKNLRMDRN